MASFLYISLVVATIDFSMACATSSNCKDGNRATEAFNERWRAAFEIIDADNDGVFTWDECDLQVQRFIDYFHPTPNLLHGITEFCRFYDDANEYYFGVDNTQTSVTESEYIGSMGCYWSNHLDLFKQSMNTLYTAMFHAIDSDNDGVVDFGEFQYYYNVFGDDESLNDKARKAFDLIDADCNDEIGEDEFREAYVMYLVNPDITFKELPLF